MDALPFGHGGGFVQQGASQFGGGGFSPSPAGENNYGAAGKKSGAATNVPETVRHVSIRQLYNETKGTADDNWQVMVVGKITAVQDTAVNVIYTVHDGTGSMDLYHFTMSDDPQAVQRKAELTPHTYVCAMGTLRRAPNEGGININAYTVKPVQDFNEVQYHTLQVIFQHLHLTRGGPPATKAPGGYAGPAVIYNDSTIFGAPAGSYAPQGGSTGNINNDVLSVYTSPANSHLHNGLNHEEVERQLRERGMHYSLDQIRQTVESLSNEGTVYETSVGYHKCC